MKFLRKVNKNFNIIALTVLLVLFFTVPVYAEKIESGLSATEDQIYSTLLSEGYSHAGACGILANISVENPNYVADLEANNGHTYGLFQWSDVGERRKHLIIWCNNRLLESDTVEGQLAFALYEMDGGDPIASRLKDYLANTNDPVNAAMEFAVGFERCIGSTTAPASDGIYDGIIYPEHYGEVYQALTRRMDAAKLYDEAYRDYSIDKRNILGIREALNRGIVDAIDNNIEITILKTFDIKPRYGKGMLWLFRILCVLVGYLFGCVQGPEIVSKQVKHTSIYNLGDGTPDTRNVLQSLGMRETIVVFLINMAKTALAIIVGYLITRGALFQYTILWTGLGIILGNNYPFFNRFYGGFGITVTALVFIAYMPLWGCICCVFGIGIGLAKRSYTMAVFVASAMMLPVVFADRGIISGLFIILFIILMGAKNYDLVIDYMDLFYRVLILDRFGRKSSSKRSSRKRAYEYVDTNEEIDSSGVEGEMDYYNPEEPINQMEYDMGEADDFIIYNLDDI